MSAINDGGPAFPGQWVHGSGQVESWTGMTLRDYLAAKALPLAYNIFHEGYTPDILANEGLAKAAYQLADAMLAERNKS